jgi:hypothetical protein
VEGLFFLMLQELDTIQSIFMPKDYSRSHYLRWYLALVMKLWGKHIAGPIMAAITIIFVIISAVVGGDATTAARLVKWSAWLTGIAAVLLMLRAQYDAWIENTVRAETFEARLKKIDEAKPALKLNLPNAVYVEEVYQRFTDGKGNVLHEQTASFLKVRFINDPIQPYPSANSSGVRAYIDYHRLADNQHVLRIDGRWAESDQPSAYKAEVSKAPLLAAPFGIGEAKSVDVAYYDARTKQYYAWNNDNYNYDYWTCPSHLLKGNRFRIDIRLRGDWIDQEHSFIVRLEKRTFTIEAILM